MTLKSMPPRPRVHLGYLDGLRGLAALQVVAFHAYVRVKEGGPDAPIPGWFAHLTGWLGYGHYAVAVFIVLSGYCLMIPVANTPDWRLRGGIAGFVRRRARRILPPYYVALALAILLMYAGIRLSGGQSRGLIANLSPGSILSHLFLVHHLQYVWATTIDPPMWSVGLEWQIYFVFALVLLPISRKWGIIAAVVVAFAIGLTPQYLLPAPDNLSWTCPWYIGLFALGMLGAVVNFSDRYRERRWNRSRFWAAGLVLVSASFVALVNLWPGQGLGGKTVGAAGWLSDVVVGGLVMCLLCFCTASLHEQVPSPAATLAIRLFQSRPLVFLGTMSYSLYLVHQPLIEGIYYSLSRFHLAFLPLFALFFGVVIPAVTGLAWLFHRAFERRFMNAAVAEPRGKVQQV